MAITSYRRYNEPEQKERPVRLDKTEGFVIIEGRVYPAREVVEALAQSGYSQIRTVGDSLFLGRKRITPIFKSRQERAMAALCHGSLAFCCPLSKRCPDRDRALEVLGLSKQDYVRLKEDSHIKFVRAARGLSPIDDEWSNESILSRTVSRPAIDPGFGSDDYRRDFDELDRVLSSKKPDFHTGRTESRVFGSRDYPTDRRSIGATSSSAIRGSMSSRPHSDRTHRSLMEEMTRAVQEPCTTSCDCESEESVGGIASLFAQGEISPFKDESARDNVRPSFCFACGRSIKPNTSICPYCGSIQ